MLAFGAVVAAWTVAHGASLWSVFYAMYPFRLDAAQATASGTTGISWNRLQQLGSRHFSVACCC